MYFYVAPSKYSHQQNIQSTSERALRSGDAGTVADLVLSHHKTLQLMLDYCSQMESIGHDLEVAKMALTKHIHRKLQQVIQLQKKVANSNSQLVLLHEHIKLARKRFEILEQVCSTPRVLVNVLSEVERRRTFNSTLEKVRRSCDRRLCDCTMWFLTDTYVYARIYLFMRLYCETSYIPVHETVL